LLDWLLAKTPLKFDWPSELPSLGISHPNSIRWLLQKSLLSTSLTNSALASCISRGDLTSLKRLEEIVDPNYSRMVLTNAHLKSTVTVEILQYVLDRGARFKTESSWEIGAVGRTSLEVVKWLTQVKLVRVE
jgi:hypothetical protein